MNIKPIIKELKLERDRLNTAIAALAELKPEPVRYGAATSFNPAEFETPKPKRRKMSKAARAKIAAAQRKRWAAVKAKK
jgi:hypothetical protein